MRYDALVAHAEANALPPPEGDKIEFGGVELRRFDIPAGTLLVSHCHSYDHPSILASGRGELWTADNQLRLLDGPTEVKIPAGTKHAFQAITDCVWYCLKKETE